MTSPTGGRNGKRQVFADTFASGPKFLAAGIHAAGSHPENVGEADENVGMVDGAIERRAQISSRLNILTRHGAICQYQDCRWPNYLKINDADCRATGVRQTSQAAFRKQKCKETSNETSVVFFLFSLRENGVLCLDKESKVIIEKTTGGKQHPNAYLQE